MKDVFNYILIPLFIIILITGCTQNAPDTKGDDQNEDFYKNAEPTGTSCCTPYCVNLNAQECKDRDGVSTGLSCSEIDECKEGCCLPFCQDIKKVECSASIGYGGDWLDKSCKEVEECDEFCCEPFHTLETKAECEMLGGEAEPAEDCKTEKVKGTLTIEIMHDNACDCGSSDGFGCKEKNGITEKLTATLMPDPNPSKDDIYSNYGYGDLRYLKGEGTYTIAGSGAQTTVSSGEYNCHAPPVPDFKIPVIITKTTRDDLFGTTANTIKMTILKENGEYKFQINPDFLMKGAKIRSFVDSTERKSCNDPDEDASTNELNEDPAVDIEPTLPYTFVSDSLKGKISFKSTPSYTYTACRTENTGTITFNFEDTE